MPRLVDYPRFLYAGLNGPYSVIPLQRLMQHGLQPQAILLAQASPVQSAVDMTGVLPVAAVERPWQLAATAASHGLRMHNCPEPADIEAVIARYSAEVVLVAGWPRRVPAALLSLPRYGWLNLHPSLLPAYRGPAPLFWQLREGAMLGISLHKMDAGLDTGPLLAQASCQAGEGESLLTLESRLAEVGAGLFSAALGKMRTGLAFRQQPGKGQSRQGWPQAEDFIIDSCRPARVVYNFLMAMRAAGKPCGLKQQNTVLNVRAVLGWQPRKVTIDCDAGVLEIETGE